MRVKIDGAGNYKCDYCKRNFTEERAGHLVLSVTKSSGVVSPVNSLPGWRFWRVFKRRTLHFCLPTESDCLPKFFRVMSTDSEPNPLYATGHLR